MKTMDVANFLISAGSNYEDLKNDGKLKALETIFIRPYAGKTKKKLISTYLMKPLIINN
ncbi:hypothetical protein [Methanobrevibacter sp.]|uniref:hypothetical protein n=1 Tax=Methanobrevibacter sp. TaxID=66852 RepID=UPI0026E072D3|nr:hypothetical protein [Methanobrevibacter sp.]MDO5824068.1 hypothetical protein [Methanobrevibacter sp.]